ncbi:hypothetical protein AGABI2DRAFT_122561 [Agaricus bisporus var. bisporus H97]|uniref:hypothetical protein n=1 Tax=Agaricus bisporus var. bisporus (strain H97 / ATCC MYA-4626 / FGSC 10389) TaxID=936046 RepID=UPI00029F7EBE|nr:hypothetical protein AGABI2DRAFT_122561 [Agaricus bisporus var. bisporus H97]EKV42331.1 hypothetical protein AGABI2DRAFT_122561 [Agaricus bisporus var. bisporus H97]
MPEHPTISYQISLRRRRFELANAEHLHRLEKLRKRSDFTGSLSVGKATQHIAGPLRPVIHGRKQGEGVQMKELDKEATEVEEEEEYDENEAQLGDDLEAILSISVLE